MKVSHYRSPSDPGPKIRALCREEASNSSEDHYRSWLTTLSAEFQKLSQSRRIHTLDTLINLCGSKEMIHLSDILPTLLYRDFLRLLPAEVSIKILIQLDEKSLLNCCLVSKYWNNLVNSFREIWIHMAKQVGAQVLLEPSLSTQMYKKLFIRSINLVQAIKTKTAFQEAVLEGHRGRVMAICYGNGQIATGSDDHTVRFWEVATGDCIKLIHTHSVSALTFDQSFLYTASYDNTAACWDINSGQLLLRYIGHVSAVFSLDAKSSLDRLATGSADKTVKIWQLSSGLLLHTLCDWHTDWVTHVSIISFDPGTDGGQEVLQLASVDRHGCCFWTITDNQKVDVCVTHTASWCMKVPCSTADSTISVCTWDEQDQIQSVATYGMEPMEQKGVPSHLSSLRLPQDLPPKQTVLGIGKKFAVFMVDVGYSRVVIVDIPSDRILCSIPVPPYRPTQNGASVTLGQHDWLDGFTDTNRSGLFLAVCLKDNNILRLNWRPQSALLS